jgi:hypothetical protein
LITNVFDSDVTESNGGTGGASSGVDALRVAGAGPTYVLQLNGPIYGEQDFVNQVDNAFRKITAKRTR